MSQPARPALCLSRRRALGGAALAGVGLPVLAACGGDDGSDGAGEREPGADAPPPGEPIVGTAEVPVGGAWIDSEQRLVVTQPTAGEFKAFDGTCSHARCAVSAQAQGQVICTCHGSRFAIEDGSVLDGPAPEGLTEIAVRVEGDQVVRS
ncbi:Rieske (2Fe-2S) protein [Nocardioides massiliensis]|uniref:Cytochrome bc1 complex Rieske iron-sulfur subunit n=1 Tax=Nocardioides massiliensis TaxID=1325935 RepID=A0ABT9NRT8_9ACTN|nr:Rieske (2Fe-2S) protein [Nocardioides massiliensis]MDP9823136.1 Rieske Fe-S protein [Nocardioides massiliensis]